MLLHSDRPQVNRSIASSLICWVAQIDLSPLTPKLGGTKPSILAKTR